MRAMTRADLANIRAELEAKGVSSVTIESIMEGLAWPSVLEQRRISNEEIDRQRAEGPPKDPFK